MKRIIVILLLASASVTNAQVVIGGTTGSALNSTSVLLDFPTGQNKGLIVPYVRTLPVAPVGGTIILDATEAAAARMKFFNGTVWKDLSGQNANVVTALANQPLVTESSTSKVIIGADTSSADGALVLESTTKAMILPIVTNVNLIPNPSPGMMVYVSGSKVLAVYNGRKWSFWGPTPPIPALTSSVLIAPGVTKQFLAHNLGADTSLDPHVPVIGLQGAYIQWGQRGPNTTGDSRVDWQTAGNTANFAAAPTALNANDDNIAGWINSAAADGSWGATKTVNDPCPTGFRVPTSEEWVSVAINNTASRTGTFTEGNTSYGSALHYGPNLTTKLLTLPAAGSRYKYQAIMTARGSTGLYWSSTEDNNYKDAYLLSFTSDNVYGQSLTNRPYGCSLRCIAE